MFRRLGITLAFLALFMAAGGHWAVLQSIAWSSMLVSSRGEIQQTFDGAHPCPLCRVVSNGSAQEKKQAPAVFAEVKTEAWLFEESVMVFSALRPERTFVSLILIPAARSTAPLTPPPRAFLA